MNQPLFTSEPFIYNAPFYNVVCASTRTYTLQTQSDSDFEIQKITACAATDLNGANSSSYINTLEGVHFPNLFVQIVDEGTGRKWFSAPLSVPALFGTGQTPFTLPQTKIVTRNTVLSFTVNNNYVSGQQDIAFLNFTLIGRKIKL